MSRTAASKLSQWAWGSLAFNLGVIVWGAYVRASGSGAGCGSHWPLCNGTVIPDLTLDKTWIEFAHRVTSAGSLILAVVIAWIGVRDYARGSRVRRASLGVLGFTISEALIGAGLVLLEYVEHDKSVGRMISISLHLTNTFSLLAMLSLTAWWSSFGDSAPATPSFATPKARRLIWASIALTLLVGMSGAITALGDTLIQAGSLSGGLTQRLTLASHFLIKLRVVHPFLAVAAAALLFYASEAATEGAPQEARAHRLALALRSVVALQIALGATNLILHAPTWMQLAHLLVAELVWITLILMAVATLRPETAPQPLKAASAAEPQPC